MLAACGVASAPAETLDRVVASVGNVAITKSEVEAEYRLELFLKGSSAAGVLDGAASERVRDRLIEQKLLADEAEAEGVDRSDIMEAAKQALGDVRRQYSSEEAFQTALRVLGTTEDQVLSRLQVQVLTLRLIDQRLRPAAWVERPEIEAYYTGTFVPEFRRQNTGPNPPVDEVEPQIREILVQKKVDHLLANWLAELKAGRRVSIHDF